MIQMMFSCRNQTNKVGVFQSLCFEYEIPSFCVSGQCVCAELRQDNDTKKDFCTKKTVTLEHLHLICLTWTAEVSYQFQLNFVICNHYVTVQLPRHSLWNAFSHRKRTVDFVPLILKLFRLKLRGNLYVVLSTQTGKAIKANRISFSVHMGM